MTQPTQARSRQLETRRWVLGGRFLRRRQRTGAAWQDKLGLSSIGTYPSFPLTSILARTISQSATIKDYEQLWKSITDKTDKPEAAQALAEIVADNAGRGFILRLELEEAEMCIDGPRKSKSAFAPLLPPQMVSSGYHKTQPQTR